MRQLRLLASNSLIASISISFRSAEAVRVTTDRFGPTGKVPLHENRLPSRESVGCARPADAPEPGNLCRLVVDDQTGETPILKGRSRAISVFGHGQRSCQANGPRRCKDVTRWNAAPSP